MFPDCKSEGMFSKVFIYDTSSDKKKVSKISAEKVEIFGVLKTGNYNGIPFTF